MHVIAHSSTHAPELGELAALRGVELRAGELLGRVGEQDRRRVRAWARTTA